MPNQASIFERKAKYDAHRGELELKGKTTVSDQPPPLTVQVGAVQRDASGENVTATGYGAHHLGSGSTLALAFSGVHPLRIDTHETLPDGTPDPSWEVRVKGRFNVGDATAFGIQIEFDPALGVFTTFNWSQLITIEDGHLKDDPTDK